MSEEQKGRGRPKGSKDKVKKIKLKPSPKTAYEDYKKKYGDNHFTAIYGFDDFTETLVRYLWSDPNQEFIATDPVEQKLANFNRSIGSLSYSIYRWDIRSPIGFIEEGMFPIVVVAEEYWDTVKKLPNPHNVKLVCLSHWEK